MLRLVAELMWQARRHFRPGVGPQHVTSPIHFQHPLAGQYQEELPRPGMEVPGLTAAGGTRSWMTLNSPESNRCQPSQLPPHT